MSNVFKIALTLFLLGLSTNTVQASDALKLNIPSILVAQQSSCCKQFGDSGWRIIGYNFFQCDAWNQKYDTDDVNQQSGKIWWDQTCGE